ncbi:hypothetical protein HMPREF2939_08535 [Achromobacter xylosoxidans]|nr:hypothetical protein HMPREF2939_08535 [Achromobacter xylosoxidans]
MLQSVYVIWTFLRPAVRLRQLSINFGDFAHHNAMDHIDLGSVVPRVVFLKKHPQAFDRAFRLILRILRTSNCG